MFDRKSIGLWATFALAGCFADPPVLSNGTDAATSAGDSASNHGRSSDGFEPSTSDPALSTGVRPESGSASTGDATTGSLTGTVGASGDVGTSGGVGASSSDGTVAASSSESGVAGEGASTGPWVDRCDPLGDGSVLECLGACGRSLFARTEYVDDFDSQPAFTANWSTAFVVPEIREGTLTFGPHPMTADWPENYSGASANRDFGAPEMICARVHLVASELDLPDDNILELNPRLPAEAPSLAHGLVLTVSAGDRSARLRGRGGDDEWQVFASQPLQFSQGVNNVIDLLIYVEGGTRFIAEVYNRTAGDGVTLATDYDGDVTGHIALTGWRNRSGSEVEHLLLGTATDEVRSRISGAGE